MTVRPSSPAAVAATAVMLDVIDLQPGFSKRVALDVRCCTACGDDEHTNQTRPKPAPAVDAFRRGFRGDRNPRMSFDIFLRGFENGDGAPGRPAEANRVLQPYLRISPNGCTNVIIEDGDTEVYGVGTDGLMFTHATGRQIWDVIFDVARAGNWAIIPVGCPTCVPTSTMIADLPDELRADATVVHSGADILDAILRS